MATPIIAVRQLSKRYTLGGALQHDTLRDHIAHLVSSLRRVSGGGVPRTVSQRKAVPPGEVWALKDVSFEVRPGEVVGIIGRNGAGKSTLLKLLSQITEPTQGEARIRGRVASLLEVGTGFHPELTGRENIYLNGAILGMSRAEINRKFDEIVGFSEIEKFLDTPVKRYSSGMYMRLAFGVAANLEPEILIVDEVLAVGDVQFQKKCLGKMADVSRSGRTILFVSHNLGAVQRLCTRGILLEDGRLRYDGATADCVARYLREASGAEGEIAGYAVAGDVLGRQPANAPLRITQLQLFDPHGQPLQRLHTGEAFKLRIHYENTGTFAPGTVSFLVDLKTHQGQRLCRLSTMPISNYPIPELGRAGHLDLTFHSLPLVGGRYFLEIIVFRPGMETLVHLADVIAFEVTPTDVYGSGVLMAQDRGLVVLQHRWDHHIAKQESRSQTALT